MNFHSVIKPSLNEKHLLCHHCLEVFLEIDKDYADNFPNSCSTWELEKYEQHLESCSHYPEFINLNNEVTK